MSLFTHSNPRNSCEACLAETLQNEEAVLGAALDAERNKFVIDYDAARMSDAEAGRLAETIVPAMTQRFGRCTLRLSGRACESCAVRLERKAEKIPGVRRATATFIGGVMTINYDPAALSAEAVGVELRAAGAPVKPLVEAEH